MRHRTIRVAAVVSALLVIIPSFAGSKARAEDEATERARLRSRIAELEKTLAEMERPTPRVSLAVLRRVAPDRVSTRAAGEAGARATRDVTDVQLLERIGELSDARAGVEIFEEISRRLQEGETGFQFLYDLCRYLDRDKRLASRFVSNYTIDFGHAHLAMLHEAELARFFHFYLNASRSEPTSFMRREFYEFAPVFLAYYRDRFPELEDAFRADIVERLTKKDGNVPAAFRAAAILDFRPAEYVIEPFLRDASTFQDLGIILEHLVFRADDFAIHLIDEFIGQRRGAADSLHVRRAMIALAKMKNLEAEALLERFLADPSPGIRETATLAFYAVPRNPESIAPAMRLLRSSASDQSKRRLLLGLRKTNEEVWKTLCARSDELPEELRPLCEAAGE